MLGDLRAVADGEAVIEIAGVVEEHDGEDFVVDEALDESGGAGEDFVEVERGVNLLADFDQDGQGLGGVLLRFGRGGLGDIGVNRVHEVSS